MSDATIERERIATEELDVPPAPQLPAFSDGLRDAPQIDPANAFLPISVEDIRTVAQMLSQLPGAKFTEPKAYEALVLQAALWRVSPLFVMQAAYQAKAGGPLGYEAKLLHAVILANAPLSRRPRLRYGYGGDGKPTVANRFCQAIYYVVGEDEPITITSPTIAQIKTRNSPEWYSNPDLQLGYYTLRAGARLHFPDVLGGAYTREEVIHLRSLDASAPRERPLFEDEEPQDAVFEGVPPTTADLAGYERWEKKASGEQDSRDPRDAPQNAQGQEAGNKPRGGPSARSGPTPPPGGENEPDDAPALREWASQQQTAILAMDNDGKAADAWRAVIADKRWDRFKTYQADLAKAIKASVFGHVEKLQRAKAAGADPKTGEV